MEHSAECYALGNSGADLYQRVREHLMKRPIRGASAQDGVGVSRGVTVFASSFPTSRRPFAAMLSECSTGFPVVDCSSAGMTVRRGFRGKHPGGA
ncbi:Hypothetical protein MexAM1_META1p1959 [Methylorubrum extorquens AM1]|uniref:Uncharacterized protein n=1 Tax=Methylorubrum extorquens (strain ATCC 14718 / DSM 1338 / JCM 2805 / NCIMB 9133 / AM1) TaxID=272630 RepID=C5B1Y5_METEA|nr:Hypothetical protein MexAM1_META1p1959 [Methylorubrum extorquens AM1]